MSTNFILLETPDEPTNSKELARAFLVSGGVFPNASQVQNINTSNFELALPLALRSTTSSSFNEKIERRRNQELQFVTP
jgi:hypothetical protein